MRPLEPGTVFAHDYRVVRSLASGGMGAVYVAMQLSTGRARALKVMRPELVGSDDARRRFEQEARIGSRVESNAIVEVLAAGIDESTGAPYIVMELLVGEDLGEHVRRLGPRPHDVTADLFEQLGTGVGAAHAAGIVHRDLKPENLFLSKAGLKILDFGIAKLMDEGITTSTESVGTPLWMAPEQTDHGGITPAADVWAIGLIAYWVITGKHFWRSGEDPHGSLAMFARELLVSPIPLASERAREQRCDDALPVGFDEVFARAVARDPARRFPDASVACAALVSILRASPARALQFGKTIDASILASSTGAHEVPPRRHPPYVWPRNARQRIRALLDDIVGAGDARVLVVRGAARVGRSRMLEAIAAEASNSPNSRCLVARARRRDGRRFAPLHVALEGHSDLAELHAALERGERDAGAGGTGASLVASALVAVARTQPTILFIHDAHLADEATLDLVLRIAEARPKCKLGIVVSAVEPCDSPGWDEVLPAIVRHGESLRLGAFDDEVARDFVRGIAPMSDDAVALVVASGAGVPGALVDATLRLHERGALVWKHDRWTLAPGSHAIFEEGSPAEACAKDLLAALSALGDPVPDDVIASALARLGHREEAIVTALRGEVAAGVLLRDDRGMRLAPSSRVQPRPAALRAVLGELAANPEADAHAEVLATGWAHLDQREQARKWLEVAIKRASEGGSFRHAAELAGRLATFSPSAIHRNRTLVDRAVLLRRAGLPRLARAQLALVDREGLAPSEMVRLRVVDAELRAEVGLREASDEALIAEVDRDGGVLERVDVRLALARLSSPERASALIDEVRKLGADLDLAHRLRVELLAAEQCFRGRDLRSAREHVRDAAALAEAAGILWRAIEPAMDLVVLTADKDPAAALDDLERLEARASDAGLEKLARLAAHNRATLELRAGRHADAVARLRDVCARAEEAGDTEMEGGAWNVLSDALQKVGDLPAARQAAEEAVRIKTKHGDVATSLALLRLATVLREAGAPADARDAAVRALEWAEANPYLDLAPRARLWIAIHDARMSGKTEDLEALVRELRTAPLRAPTRALLDEAESVVKR